MKKVAILAFLMAGCSKENVSTTPDKVIVVQMPCPDKPDNFDMAGQMAANGARVTYNKAKGVYEWVFSDEHKAKAEDLLNQAKAGVVGE
jgi:PBP1b-binding outer membrane lipoprotein LpoB